jgi:ribonuclease D
LQISTRSCDYVVDTLALHDDMHLLRAPFANSRITKVFHGSDNDIVWLQRDFHIYPVNLFDTYRAAIALEKPQKSLAFLLQCYCGVGIDKRFQKSDWRLRPLPKELLEYARTDAHYLVYIAECLRQELLGGKAKQSAVAALTEADARTGRSTEEEEADGPDEESLVQPLDGGFESAAQIRLKGEASAHLDDVPASTEPSQSRSEGEAPKPSDKPHAISLELYAEVLRRSNLLCLQLYDKESSSSSSAASLIARHYSTPAGAQLARQQNPEQGLRFRELVRALCEWRDKTAREEDESLRAVLTDSALIGVALACPKTASDLLESVRESDRHGVLERSKHAQHPFSEKHRSPSLVLERHVSAACAITARFTASHVNLPKPPSPSEENAGASAQDTGMPETARGSQPGGAVTYAKVARSAREPSGWARVEDDSLSKKAHPAKQHRDPVAARARFVNKFACKKTVYENCRIYAGDGRLLCYCDRSVSVR